MDQISISLVFRKLALMIRNFYQINIHQINTSHVFIHPKHTFIEIKRLDQLK